MKATDFLEEWNSTHTSSPTYQDVLAWLGGTKANRRDERVKQ